METYFPRKWVSFKNQENEEIAKTDLYQIERKLMAAELLTFRNRLLNQNIKN